MNHNEERTSAVHPKVAYQPHHLNLRALFYIMVVVLVLAVLIHVGMWWLLRLFTGNQRSAVSVMPPEPRLQIAPALDWHAKQAQATQLLNSYGWVDRQEGVLRIPIEQAMKLIAERGLPIAADNPTQVRAGETSVSPAPEPMKQVQ